MKKIYKNLSPDLKSFNSNSLNNQNSQLSKLIEETILEFNIKYNSITNMLNQLKQNLFQRLNNIQEISIGENSSLNFQKIFNKSQINFISNSTRNFIKQNFMKISHEELKKKGINQNFKSLNFGEKKISNINKIYSPKVNKNKNNKNKKKISRPNKPHLNYNNNNNNNNNNETK